VERAETVEERHGEKREEKRGEILAAAVRVLARDGIAETTTRKIALEAGVNQAMLRYYFGSKDELLFAVLQEMMRQTREIAQAAASAQEDIRAAIAESLKAFWKHVEDSPELQVMQYELTLYALRTPSAAWLAKQQYDGYSVVVEALLQEAFATAQQTPALPFAALARFIIAGLDGLILQFISDRDPERARNDLDHLIAATIALVEGTALP
jgi:AcrR family transcriptional regulator